MEIYHGLENISYNNIVIALGNFDGVHLGHRELIRRAVEMAEKVKGMPAVLTFDPHPLKVLQPDCSPPMLLTKEDKTKILGELGIKLLVISPFSEEISKLSPREFVQNVLVDKFHAKAVVIGYNYNFGYKGAGDTEEMVRLGNEYGMEVLVVPPVKLNGTEVSSTLIRQLMLKGNVAAAARFLGYFPFIISRVVSGDKRGTQIGFPTANINLPDDILVPANGVYAVKVYVNGKPYNGVANIGIKPTFNLNQPKNLEVHIMDFRDDLYNVKIKVEFIERIRGEREFPSVQELIKQITDDIREAQMILHPRN